MYAMCPDERQKKIINLVRDKNRMTVAEITEQFEECQRTIRRDINYLVDKQVLISNKNRGGYVTINPNYRPLGNSVSIRDLNCLKEIIDLIPEGELRASALRIYSALVNLI